MVASLSRARRRDAQPLECSQPVVAGERLAPSAVRSSVSTTADASPSQSKRGSRVAFSNGMTSCRAPMATSDWALALSQCKMQNAKCKRCMPPVIRVCILHFAF